MDTRNVCVLILSLYTPTSKVLPCLSLSFFSLSFCLSLSQHRVVAPLLSWCLGSWYSDGWILFTKQLQSQSQSQSQSRSQF